jgi:hypothetical protein
MTVNEKRFNYKWLALPLITLSAFFIGLLMDVPFYQLGVVLEFTFILFLAVTSPVIFSLILRLPIKGFSTRQKEYLSAIIYGILFLFVQPDSAIIWALLIICGLILVVSLTDTLLNHIDFKIGSQDQPIFSWRTLKTKKWFNFFTNKPDGPVELIVFFSAFLLFFSLVVYFVLRYITPTLL